ncbi:hypothetical protein [Nocardia brasiliensis]|uniref:Uncharacterized protein n=1 Tax=Nocardia brasiliensis (strain ATCC 700358 / HUJEG-1) TaxID=1133849 RepID=K0F4V3_NOCB7|nr:hypothetical protein [Nocardia brasiliensis]AFU04692.1 hypothetical protein O3I_033715 [Nocardia brasiliensis ATCC 700358]OCF88329.1 hypothetical protein AW168_21825 [Nocardia brasiliensis]
MASRYRAVALLFALPPLTAEVLSGYSGHATPLGVVTAVLIAGPLYGAVAVLIREAAVRTGLGWVSILLVCGAFGMVQAGLIDQSLLDQEHFADSPYWAGRATEVPGVGIDISQLLVFVGGHAMVTFGAPIALVEGIFARSAAQPWLRRPGLAVFGLLYLGAASLFCYELVVVPGLVGSPVRLAGVSAVVVVLVVVAFALPRRPHRWPTSARFDADGPGKWRDRAPHPTLVGSLTVLSVGTHMVLRAPEPLLGPLAWVWVAASVAPLTLLAYALHRWSRRRMWRRAHLLAVAFAPLICTALLAFAVPPVHDGNWPPKLISNTAALLILLVAWLCASRITPPSREQQAATITPTAATGGHRFANEGEDRS